MDYYRYVQQIYSFDLQNRVSWVQIPSELSSSVTQSGRVVYEKTYLDFGVWRSQQRAWFGTMRSQERSLLLRPGLEIIVLKISKPLRVVQVKLALLFLCRNQFNGKTLDCGFSVIGSIPIFLPIYAPVAQRIEQGPSKPCVVRSSRTGRANVLKKPL